MIVYSFPSFSGRCQPARRAIWAWVPLSIAFLSIFSLCFFFFYQNRGMARVAPVLALFSLQKQMWATLARRAISGSDAWRSIIQLVNSVDRNWGGRRKMLKPDLLYGEIWQLESLKLEQLWFYFTWLLSTFFFFCFFFFVFTNSSNLLMAVWILTTDVDRMVSK